MPRCVRTAHVFDKKWRSDDVRLQEEASFSSLLLPEKILLGLENAGYKTPSPIQLESIPVGRFGRDLLVQAKSGTGKTLVFTVIALESLSEIKYPQVLIMAPTREIALQICDVVRAVGSAFKGLTCNCFIGGIAVDSDVEKVHGCQIIVGTPGRLKHLISLGILPTNSIRLLVMDEADVLLESNFKDDLDYIFVSLPKEKQVIATSATYPRELRSLTRQYFRKVYLARLNRNELTLLGMVHYIQVLELPKMSLLAYKAKLAALEKVVTSVQFTQCLVFCNLISRVESLCYDIRNWGFTSTFISSAKEQCDRIRAIECLKRFRCKILVTSDITSRGIDAENVDLVINFDKPLSTEVYFHRCGRAGRYGAKGVAITFLEKDEVIVFEQMKLKHNLKAYNLPDPIPANLINIRPREYNSSTENSEDEDDDLSDSNDLDSNKDPSDATNNGKTTKEKSCADPSVLSNGNISSNLNGNVIERNGADASSDKNTNCFVDPSTLSNGNISSILNGNLIESKVMNELTSSDKNTSRKSDPPGECIDKTDEKTNCVCNELNISNTSDAVNSNLIPKVAESDNNNQKNMKDNFECISNRDNHFASEISVTNELVEEKNFFLEYLGNGPKKAESLPSSCSALVSDSGVIVNNDTSSDPLLLQELKSNSNCSLEDLKSNTCSLEANNTGDQNDVQHSSEVQCLNNINNELEGDDNGMDSKDFNQDVSKEEIKENFDKLIPSIDTLESITGVENNNVLSVDTSTPALPNTLSPDLVSKECSNETRSKFVPNKIQLSVGKFLIEHKNNCDLNNLQSNNNLSSIQVDLSSNNNCSVSSTETEQDVTKSLKDVREDLNDFYYRVYKAYQDENINNAAFEDIKELLMQQKEEEIKKSAIENIIPSNTEKITSETIDDECNKENSQNPTDLKFCDNESNNGSLHSSKSISSLENTSKFNQVFDRYVFKDNSVDNSLSGSDSSCNEDSYLTLKGTFDNMKASEKMNSKSNLHVSKKNKKDKCIDMKKKKFSVKGSADKKQHLLPANLRKLSVSSSSEGTENKLQEELHGARKKIYNDKPKLRRESNKHQQAKHNMTRSKYKAKSCNAVRISEKPNSAVTTESEISEDQHNSKYSHNTSTPYFKGSRSANAGCRHITHAANSANMPFTSPHHGHATSTVNCEHIPSMSQPHEHATNAVNYGHVPFMSQPHEYTTNSVNYGNFPSVNYQNEYQLPNYHYSYSTNGYAPNQVNISHAGHESLHPFGNVCCQSANWYQIYKKQWEFIQSSLF